MAKTTAAGPLSFYVAIGSVFKNFSVDIDKALLQLEGEITLPSRLQYAWPHPNLQILYAACADRTPGLASQPFYLCALKRDAIGNLTFMGEPVSLPSRPIHLTVDHSGLFVLTAYSAEPGLTVHALLPDGQIGAEVPPADGFEAGPNPHEILVMPGNTRAILMARGKKGATPAASKPGELNFIGFNKGRVENQNSIRLDEKHSPGGFNPRNMEFHPSNSLVYLTLEIQNKLAVFSRADDDLELYPRFLVDTLIEPDNVRPKQDCGAVRLHPSGRFAYVANRNDGYVGDQKGRPSWISPNPPPIFPGGENNIAVYKIESNGAPSLIQHIDSHGLHPRTFAIDPSGSLLIAGNLAPTVQKQGEHLIKIPANLALFRIGADGRLTFLRRHDLDVGEEMVWWTGMIT